MRLEILVGDDEPRIYPLTKSRISIGANEDSDIFIAAEDVSRKHLFVIVEDENFFVVDQGSKNGSFINDEQLIPGERVPFKSFFPVRLGSKTIISLISDEDFENSGLEEIQLRAPGQQVARQAPEEKTQVISLTDLKSLRTAEVIKTKRSIQRKPEVSLKNVRTRDQSRMRIVSLLSFSMILLAVIYQTMYREQGQTVEESLVTATEGVNPGPPPARPVMPLVSRGDLTPRGKFDEMLLNMKCVTDAELLLCKSFQKDLGGNLGVVQRGTMLNIFLNGTDEYTKALEILASQNSNLDKMDKNEEDVALVTFFLFFRNRLPDGINYEALKGLKLTFILLIQRKDGSTLQLASAIFPEVLLKLRPLLEERYLQDTINQGEVSILNFLRQYFVMY